MCTRSLCLAFLDHAAALAKEHRSRYGLCSRHFKDAWLTDLSAAIIKAIARNYGTATIRNRSTQNNIGTLLQERDVEAEWTEGPMNMRIHQSPLLHAAHNHAHNSSHIWRPPLADPAPRHVLLTSVEHNTFLEEGAYDDDHTSGYHTPDVVHTPVTPCTSHISSHHFSHSPNSGEHKVGT